MLVLCITTLHRGSKFNFKDIVRVWAKRAENEICVQFFSVPEIMGVE